MQNQTTPNLSIFLYLILGSIGLLTPFAIDMYLPAMPTIAKDFNVDAGLVQGTLTAYTAGFTIGQLIQGPLSDSYGRKPVLIISTLFFALASYICSTTGDIDALLYSRFAQGFAGAGAAVIVQAIVRDMFDKEEFARTMSFITLVITISPLLAPIIGGKISIWFGWRFIFLLLAILAVLVLMSVYFYIPETLDPKNKHPLRLKTTLQNYFRVLSNTKAIGLILCSAFSFGGMFAFLTAGAFIYIDLYGIPKDYFGYYFALNVVAMVIMTTINGRLVRKKGSHWMLRFGLTIQTLAAVFLLLGWILDFGLWSIVPCVMFFVGTISVIGSNSMALLLTGYPALAGTASSLAGALRFGAGALVSYVISLLPSGFVWPMVACMLICAFISVTCYWFLSREA